MAIGVAYQTTSRSVTVECNNGVMQGFGWYRVVMGLLMKVLYGVPVATLLVMVLALTGCQKTDTDPALPGADVAVKCQDPRPEMCTLEYLPVCGLHNSAQGWKTFGNACAACREAGVVGYKAGECNAEAELGN